MLFLYGGFKEHESLLCFGICGLSFRKCRSDVMYEG